MQDQRQFLPIVQRIAPGSRLLRSWKLDGGISAEITGLEIQHPDGSLTKTLLRQHSGADREKSAEIVEREFRLLQLLKPIGLPVQKPYFADTSGVIMPSPYLVLEYIEGTTEFSPINAPLLVPALAQCLACIHAVDAVNYDLSFLPKQTSLVRATLSTISENPDESLYESRIRDTLTAVLLWFREQTTALLHGDYWPGNILWKDGTIVGILDWEEAHIGNPVADIARTRLEILFAYGIEPMHQFVQAYQTYRTDALEALPYWDLWAALRLIRFPEWISGAATARTMRERYLFFVESAFDAISIAT